MRTTATHEVRPPTWTRAGLVGLFTQYFGDRLAVADIERLAADTAAALVDRQASRVASVPVHTPGARPGKVAPTRPAGRPHPDRRPALLTLRSPVDERGEAD